jgi:two-component system repressor protein LuxO
METNTLDIHAKVLFVDDEESILASLKRLTRKLDAQCFFASSGAEGLIILAEESIDVVVSDMKMPEMTGVEFLTQVASSYPETIRIALTGFTDHDMVLATINDGRIWGYLQKPWDNQHLLVTLDQALFTRRLMLERMMLQRTVRSYEQFSKSKFEGFIGDSSTMQVVYHIIETAAPSNASIFITGSSGTGKEVAATAIHNRSKQKDGPFIALNCAAIPSELIESEIFGHTKGAFSGAIDNRDGAATLADGGTLFLDELAEMDISLQSKLLRFIQTGTFQKVGSSKSQHVTIRFICATNKNPQQAITDGLLREDLYYRLNVISLDLPDLKDREWDSLLLANHCLQRFAKTEDKIFAGFSEDAERLIRNYPWPGNVRQLENCINSVVIMSPGPLVSLEDLNQSLRLSPSDLADYQQASPLDNTAIAASPDNISSSEIIPLSVVERQAIEHAVAHCDGNVVKAAAQLDVSPSTLYRKIQQWSAEAL